MKSPGLKSWWLNSLGLKLWLEKSGTEISVDPCRPPGLLATMPLALHSLYGSVFRPHIWGNYPQQPWCRKVCPRDNRDNFHQSKPENVSVTTRVVFKNALPEKSVLKEFTVENFGDEMSCNQWNKVKAARNTQLDVHLLKGSICPTFRQSFGTRLWNMATSLVHQLLG